ncbi:glycosyltransferase family A protein [Salinisphaera aquimarina]|uniref:Glycosyltransferase family A protein n=1 Tax=Salinisphaera aquimarina TaxID=2094031 RepID=A0ABV7ELN6_9GAMM
MSEVSLVITSCGRLDLLERTLRSFNAHNSYPIAQTILIDDSGDKDVYRRIAEEFGDAFDEILYNEPKLGQIASIDRAYSHVRSPYIFHCEDDWLFFRKGFIEESLSVLDEDERIVTVWLRELWDANKHRIGRDIRRTDDGVMYRELATDNGTDWHGFTLNPGLRRRADYERIKPFTDVGHEYEINIRYWELGFHAAILEQGATEHIGFTRSERKKEIGSQGPRRTWLQKRLGLNKSR